MSVLPDAQELLAIARETVLKDIVPALPEAQRYSALMVASALAIAARETAGSAAAVGFADEEQRRLVAAIREGGRDGDAALVARLREMTKAKLAASNPKLLQRAGTHEKK